MRRRIALWAGILAPAVGLLALAGCGGATSARSAALPLPSTCIAELELFGPRPPPPQAVSTPLDAAILARYALFRRAARPEDAPRGLAHELAQGFTLARWYPAYVRALGPRARGARYYAVPAFGLRRAVPRDCEPAAARREVAAQQRRRPTEPVVCLIAVGGAVGGPRDCEPFAAIEADAALFASAGRIDPIVSLVPDGVAALRISYRTRPAVVVPVSDNAIAFVPPATSPRLRALQRAAGADGSWVSCSRAGHGEWRCRGPGLTRAQSRRLQLAKAAYAQVVAAADPTQIEWLDAAGRVIRTLQPPTRAFLESIDVGQLRAPIGG